MIKEFYLDLYNRTFVLAVGEPKEVIDEYLSTKLETKIDIDISGCLGLVDNYSGPVRTVTFIYLASGSDDIFNMGTIVHESYHAAHYMFKIVGIDVDTNNDDVGAYVIDWVFRQILTALREVK